MDKFTKITIGFVTQTYNKDRSGSFVCTSQEFIAGDQVDYEDQNGNVLTEVPDHVYQPFTMKTKKMKGRKMLYLKLFHGRKHIFQQMDDWGSDGPIFGPYEFVHTTYAGHLKMSTQDILHELYVVDDVLYYDGIYYGDWSVFSTDALSTDDKALHQPYEQAKSVIPSLSKQKNPPVKIVVYIRGGVCEIVKVNLADDDWEYAVVDYDNDPGLKEDHLPYKPSECRTVLILPKGHELAEAAKEVVKNWPTSKLAPSVRKLDGILKNILPPISGD